MAVDKHGFPRACREPTVETAWSGGRCLWLLENGQYLSEMRACIPGSPVMDAAWAAEVSRWWSEQGSGFGHPVAWTAPNRHHWDNGAKTHQAEQGSGLWEPTEGHLELQEWAWCWDWLDMGSFIKSGTPFTVFLPWERCLSLHWVARLGRGEKLG